MGDTPDIVHVTSSFAYGLVVPAGGLALVRVVSETPTSGPLGGVLPVIWLVAIALGTVALGVGVPTPTDALVGGTILGTVVGFAAFATVVGWSFVMFAVALVALLAVVTGAAASEAWHRHRDSSSERGAADRRHVIVLLAALLIGLLVFLFR